ncbi:MAG TPA: ATP-binding protein [Cyclobacteriaceae bacterium]
MAEDLLSNYAMLEESGASVLGSWVYIPLTDEFIWSDGMYSLFGIERGTKVNPDIYNDFSTEDYRDVAKKIVKSIYDGTTFEEFLQVKTNGSVKTLRVFGAPRDTSGERHVVGVDLDVTEQDIDKRPKGTAPSYQQLKQSDKTKTLFLNNLGHEFQNPMNVILESLDKVIRKLGSDLPDNVYKELLHAQKNSVRVEKLVKSLHDFTHLEHRKTDARFVPTDLCKLTTEVAANFRSVIEKAGLMFSIQCDRMHEPVYVDHVIFETVLYNLLSNAFKFTFEGGITIRVINSRKHVKIAVADTGNGITTVNQKKIFQRFSKVDSENARSLDGMGIGLPLVKDLVEFHGGSISVNSELKKGSEFIVSLPKGMAHLPADKILMSGNSNHRGSFRGTLHQLESWANNDNHDVRNGTATDDHRVVPTVLIAESDSEMRDYIARSLNTRYRVLEAVNGQHVLDIIGTGVLPDLIVADVAMPKMNGFEFLTSIRNSVALSSLPFILLTSRTVADDEIKGLYFGADDYLVKPFTARELVARIETRIEIAASRKKPVQSLAKENNALEERIHHYMDQVETYNKELNEKNAKLSAANEDLTDLTFAASHDLQEPLRKIKLFIGCLLKEEKNNFAGNSAHYFKRIVSFVETMNDLVNDITLYANFNATVGPTSKIDLQIMLSSLTDFLMPIMRDKGASIKFEVADGLTGHYDQVKQAIYNLISNALKFGRKDVPLEIIITGKLVPATVVGSERADQTKSYYQVSVHDNGIGIDHAYYKQIFELFRKLHEKSAYPGTGVGLTIVRKIMENHNGFVSVDSKPHEGSTFSCFFPVMPLS